MQDRDEFETTRHPESLLSRSVKPYRQGTQSTVPTVNGFVEEVKDEKGAQAREQGFLKSSRTLNPT